MQLLAVGLNHTTAPVSLREQLAFAPDQLGQAVMAARAWFGRVDAGGSDEAAILSTCNRTELYAASDIAQPLDAGAHFLADFHRLNYAELRPHLYMLPQHDAVRHTFRVASGLDSMVLGETQILGQIKDAIRTADAAGGLGTYLHQLFQRSFSVAKEVRSTTEIGANSVSMAAAAVRLSQRIFDKLGEQLAHRYGGKAIRLADLQDRLHQYDIVISCTASSLPLIGLGMVERAIKARRHKPMFMVDLAVPRDIEAEVGRLNDVFLYTVDDLGKVVQTGLESRQAAVAQAEAIIETRVQS